MEDLNSNGECENVLRRLFQWRTKGKRSIRRIRNNLSLLPEVEDATVKKCYFLGARDLKIAGSDTPQFCKWTSLPESRFPEVANLKRVGSLDIQVKVRAGVLSPRTSYAAYLVYKLEDEPDSHRLGQHMPEDDSSLMQSHIHRAKLREDGWFEVKLCEYSTENEDDFIEIHLKWTKDCAYQEEGLIVEGIEMRPRMG